MDFSNDSRLAAPSSLVCEGRRGLVLGRLEGAVACKSSRVTRRSPSAPSAPLLLEALTFALAAALAS
eukprot:1335005-Pyramimonas_sp.AAC.1